MELNFIDEKTSSEAKKLIFVPDFFVFLTNFIGFTFYPYISNLAMSQKKIAYAKTNKLSYTVILISIII